ncbi:50S ribosomal protein L23 [bacterium]|nr:50S ribosomal protein L23 [bacterium]|tara:strand:- start:1155 stop:1436 length:282 start_codon:yes stop_codon:yes gene_type:complete
MEEIILKPYITEKTSAQMVDNKFTFLSSTDNVKIEIKNFLIKKYDISIKSIKILKKVSKKVRRGKYPGKTKSFKKVILTLKNDKNIDKIKELF